MLLLIIIERNNKPNDEHSWKIRIRIVIIDKEDNLYSDFIIFEGFVDEHYWNIWWRFVIIENEDNLWSDFLIFDRFVKIESRIFDNKDNLYSD